MQNEKTLYDYEPMCETSRPALTSPRPKKLWPPARGDAKLPLACETWRALAPSKPTIPQGRSCRLSQCGIARASLN